MKQKYINWLIRKMEKITEWVKTCLHKSRMAGGHADQVIKRAKDDGIILYKYFCPHCQGWHVTKKERNESNT